MPRSKKKLKELTPSELAAILKNGTYKKGIGALYYRPRNEYCCLGVYANEMGLLKSRPERNLGHVENLTTYLPRTCRPSWMNEDIMDELIRRNDNNDTWQQVIEFLESLIWYGGKALI